MFYGDFRVDFGKVEILLENMMMKMVTMMCRMRLIMLKAKATQQWEENVADSYTLMLILMAKETISPRQVNELVK